MNEILKKENILCNCRPGKKEDIIRSMGELLYDSGYVQKEYIEAMIQKEGVFNTNIGNEVAIPHGIESARGLIKNTGIAIMVFPEGTDWGNEEKVKIVIGIAGKEEEHIGVLEKIATVLSEPEAVEQVVHSDIASIYQLFMEDFEK